MVQSSIATKTQSFDLVKSEIEQTIKQAEASLERFQENRESGEDLQNCVDYLNQLRGIFLLVELKGGMMLCQEAVAVANDVPVGANDDKNRLLTALSSGLFILRRYVEYYRQERADHPELLLPVTNDLREARGEKPHPESCFFEINIERKPDYCAVLGPRPLEDGIEFETYARRMRMMFQVGLLGVLRERNETVSLKLLARASRGFSRLCIDTRIGEFWCLMTLAMDTMLDRAMGFGKSRKRLLVRAEKYSRELVYVGEMATRKSAEEDLFRDLVYILYRSGSGNPEVSRVLNEYQLGPAEFPEHLLEAHRKRLYGPGTDVLRSLSEALLEELNQLKDKVDIIERGIEPDLGELEGVSTSLDSLSNTLAVLGLSQLSDLSRKEAARLRAWLAEGRLPEGEELYGLANAVLSIEDAANQLVTRGITSETDTLASVKPASEWSLYLREAVIVVADEARAAMTLAKRAITAFIESEYDKMHLANVPGTLRSIWGGFAILEDEAAASVLYRIIEAIETGLLEDREPPSAATLEGLADALTSLEYYIDTIGTSEPPNRDLLKLADQSLSDVEL